MPKQLWPYEVLAKGTKVNVTGKIGYVVSVDLARHMREANAHKIRFTRKWDQGNREYKKLAKEITQTVNYAFIYVDENTQTTTKRW